MEHYEIRLQRGSWVFRQVGCLCTLGRGYSRMEVLIEALSHLKVRTSLLHDAAELVVFRMTGTPEATYTILPGEEPTRQLHPPEGSHRRSRTDSPSETEPRDAD